MPVPRTLLVASESVAPPEGSDLTWETQTWAEALSGGFHRFVAYDEMLLVLPPAAGRTAPAEARAMLIDSVLKRLRGGGHLALLVPPCSEAPGPEGSDDFGRARGLVRDLLGLDLEARAGVSELRIACVLAMEPDLPSYLTAHRPHYVVRGDISSLGFGRTGPSAPIAGFERIAEEPVVVVGNEGKGTWLILPLSTPTPSGAQVLAALRVFRMAAGKWAWRPSRSPALWVAPDSHTGAPPADTLPCLNLAGNGRSLTIQIEGKPTPCELRYPEGQTRTRPLTLRNRAGKLLLAAARADQIPPYDFVVTSRVRAALWLVTEGKVDLLGSGDDLRVVPGLSLAQGLRDQLQRRRR